MCLEMFGDDLTTVRKVIPYTGLKLWLTIWLLRRVIRQETWGHGIGRHTPDEVWSIATADLTAISDFLGKVKLQDVDKIFYIFGDHMGGESIVTGSGLGGGGVGVLKIRGQIPKFKQIWKKKFN